MITKVRLADAERFVLAEIRDKAPVLKLHPVRVKHARRLEALGLVRQTLVGWVALR